MTEVDRILNQLDRAYKGEAWHGPSVRELLAGVTAEQAQARPLANAHNIWELVHHIAVWENAGRRRLAGDPAQIDISSPADWPPPVREAIARINESRLDEPIVEGLSSTYVTLHGIIQHDLYHAGQIAMLKKAL